ncbi:hypothetical protein G7Y79_00001g000880 [Physcia stellaris]|nr:hypothetical protein G7Y79_00001g000880 [Physcia stellaris]
MLPSSTALDIASATSAFTTSISSAPYDDVNIGRRTAELCPSFISTWGVDGLHFTQYTTYIPCAGTSAWTSLATDTPTTTESGHAAQDAGFRLSHAGSLGFVIGVSVGVSVLLVSIGVAFWFRKLKEKYLKRGREEIRAENQAQAGQVVNPPINQQI